MASILLLPMYRSMEGHQLMKRLITVSLFVLSFISQTAFSSEIFLPSRNSNFKGQSGQFLTPRVTEFPNGNIFVRLNPPTHQQALSFHGKNVVIPSGASLSDHDLLEVLMIGFTSVQYFAGKITLSVDGPELKSSLPTELIHSLLFSAGFRELCYNTKKCMNIRPARFPEQTFPGTENAAIIGDDYQNLAASMQKNLNLTSLNPASLPSRLDHKLVYIILPAHAPGNQWLVRSFQNAFAVAKKGGYPFLIAPYLPYARTDKPERAYGSATGGRLIANLIEAAGFKAAAFVRPHAPQSLGFFNIPVIEVTGRKTINHYLKNKNIDAVVSPDAGFQKDASKYAQELEKDIFVFNKMRDIDGKARILEQQTRSDYTGKTLAIIDDETASGSTLAMVATSLKKQGAKKVIAIVTHLAGPANKAIQCPSIDELVVTDTIPISQGQTPKFTILPIGPELSESLKNL